MSNDLKLPRMVVLLLTIANIAQAADTAKTVYPAAVLPFSDRGMDEKDAGAKVTQILLAGLAARDDLYLVEREDVEKLLQEMHLSKSGVVKSDEAVEIGRLTGAKLLITGSAIQVDKSIYLVAKIISTETSRVVAASVKGPSSGDLASLAEKLAEEVGRKVKDKAGELVPAALSNQDLAAELKKQLSRKKLPVVWISIPERHVGQPTVDPAAQTELTQLLVETGFTLIDAKEGSRSKADILIEGEGFSEFGGRIGSLVSVKARLEVKAIDRASGKVLAADRQTAVVVDLNEQIAGKAALQNAAAAIAKRLLPKIAARE